MASCLTIRVLHEEGVPKKAIVRRLGIDFRTVRDLRQVDPEVFCRLRFLPGEEAQIDFGEVGRVLMDGRLRKWS